MKLTKTRFVLLGLFVLLHFDCNSSSTLDHLVWADFTKTLFSFSCSLSSALERKKTQVERLEEQLAKLEMNATDKEENKEIALGTSKLNYLDPRISVAW